MPRPSDSGASSYAARENPAFEQRLAERTATQQADFLLPHLHEGYRVLDAGCGPGTITLGLAAAVPHGSVVGIDIQPHLVEAASANARNAGVTNATFETASLYALPFPDASFDAAFVHAVLIHLNDPAAAIAELRRVLRPGGVAGVREGDLTTRAWSPRSAPVDAHFALNLRILGYLGGRPRAGAELEGLFRAAGFGRIEVSAASMSTGSPEARRSMVATHVAITRNPANARIAIEQGWATQAELDEMTHAMEEWAELPDAMYGGTTYSALAWVD